MELLTEMDMAEVTVGRICQRSGVHRTTLYRYFEDLADLQDRFLVLYFQHHLGTVPRSPESPCAMASLYKAAVAAMRSQAPFFLACYDQPRLACFLKRWTALMDEWFSPFFHKAADALDRPMRQPFVRFSLGVSHQYLELALRNDSGWNLDELTALMIAFQRGGTALLTEEANGTHGPSPTNFP